MKLLKPELSLTRNIYIEEQANTTFQAYQSHQIDMALLFGAERDLAEKEMLEVLEFEIALANVSLLNCGESFKL